MASPTVSTIRSKAVSAWRVATRYEEKPLLLSWRSSKLAIVSTVLLGIFVDIFLYGSTVVIIPFVVEDQISTRSEDVWEVTGFAMFAYSIAAVISSPAAGIIADKASSRRSPLLAGLFFLLSGSVCLWLASNLVALLAGRVLQGISAGFLWSIGLALIVDTVGRDHVGCILGYADIALCAGLASSPPVAGTMLKKWGKDSIYGMALGLVGLDVIMRLLIIEPKIAQKWLPEEEESAVETSSEDTKASSSHDNDKTETDVESNDRETDKSTSGLADYVLIVLRSWRMLSALCGTFVGAHVLISFDVAFPVYFEDEFGWDPEKVGYLLFVFCGMSIFCVYTGHLADRHGGKWLTIAGFLSTIPSLLGLSMFSTGIQKGSFWILYPLMVCAGISMAFVNTPVMAEIVYTVRAKGERHPELAANSGGYGLAYGLFMTVFSTGSATASIGSSYLLEHLGFEALMVSLALLCAVAVVPVALCAGPKAEEGHCLWLKKLRQRKPAEV